MIITNFIKILTPEKKVYIVENIIQPILFRYSQILFPVECLTFTKANIWIWNIFFSKFNILFSKFQIISSGIEKNKLFFTPKEITKKNLWKNKIKSIEISQKQTNEYFCTENKLQMSKVKVKLFNKKGIKFCCCFY